jgi:hypothetical protein
LLSPFYHVIRAMSTLYFFPTSNAKVLVRNNENNTYLLCCSRQTIPPYLKVELQLKETIQLWVIKCSIFNS